MAPDGWPPKDHERAAAKMRDDAFVLVLRAWLLRKRAEDLVARAKGAPEQRPARRPLASGQ